MPDISTLMAERPLKLDAAADHLGVSIKTVTRQIRAGHLQAYKIGGQWFTKMSFVQAYIDAQIQRAQRKGTVSC